MRKRKKPTYKEAKGRCSWWLYSLMGDANSIQIAYPDGQVEFAVTMTPYRLIRSASSLKNLCDEHKTANEFLGWLD